MKILGIDPGLVLEQFRRAAIDRKQVKFPVSLLEGLSQSEKLLIRTLLASEEARQEMLTVSTELVLSESLASASIFEAIAATSTDDVFQFSGVEGRLEEKDRDRLSLIMFERTGGEISLEDARKALGALRRSSWETRYRALRKKIEEAEKSSNREEALRLLKVKVELERERKELSHISTVSSP